MSILFERGPVLQQETRALLWLAVDAEHTVLSTSQTARQQYRLIKTFNKLINTFPNAQA
jgi:hypothetical protein